MSWKTASWIFIVNLDMKYCVFVETSYVNLDMGLVVTLCFKLCYAMVMFCLCGYLIVLEIVENIVVFCANCCVANLIKNKGIGRLQC